MKKPNKRKKLLIIFAVMLAGILLGTTAFGYIYFTQNGDGGGLSIIPKGGEDTVNLDKRVSVLLVGADKRPGETAYNADSLIVVTADPDTKIISMLSVPRDTRVALGSDSFVKINSVVMHKGISELVNQVEGLTGITLNGYVVTNFEGFKGIIDTLGGIDMYVEKDMGPFHTGDKVDGLINLKKGEQRMNGSLALQYARWRNDALADIGRTARQQKVLKAIAKEALQASTITKLPKLVPQIMEMVETDLSLTDMLKLAKVAASFDSSNMVSQTLPGVALYLNNLSFWEVNREIAKETAQNLLLGITTDKVFDNLVMDLLDPNIKTHITVPGNAKDPNGTKSPGHNDSKGQGTDKVPPADELPGTDEPSGEDKPSGTDKPSGEVEPSGEDKPSGTDKPSGADTNGGDTGGKTVSNNPSIVITIN